MKQFKTSCLISLISATMILTSCGSSSQFSKRKYRKGVFREYTNRLPQERINSDTLFIRQQGQLSERASNYLKIDVEDSIVNIPPDSNKVKYAAFRMKLNQRVTRSSKKRFHKRWLRDSLKKTVGFNELNKREQKKKIGRQYSFERRKEISINREATKKLEDSLRKTHPTLSNREYNKHRRKEIKVAEKAAQNKTTITSIIIGTLTILLVVACIISTILIIFSGLFLVFIAIGLVLLGLFLANFFAYRKNKQESNALKNPNTDTKSAYNNSRKLNLLGMILILGIIIAGGVFTGLIFAIANSF